MCQTVDYNGEAKYYVPLRDVEGNRKSKELVINEMHHVNKKKTGLDGHARWKSGGREKSKVCNEIHLEYLF